MLRRLIVLGTVLFGIWPATVELVVEALFYWSLFAGVPDGIVTAVPWVGIGLTCLVLAGYFAGYVALFFATAGRITRWVAIALIIGAAAMVVAIVSGVATYVSFSPAIVAVLHAGSYFVAQSRKTQSHVRARA